MQDVARSRGIGAPSAKPKRKEMIDLLLQDSALNFRAVLSLLGRDELKAACRAHVVDHSGRSRADLQARLIAARGDAVESAPPPPAFVPTGPVRHEPRTGDIVLCRHRQWLVEDVVAIEGQATRVALVCLDDDNQGANLETLWELELGAKILPHESGKLTEPKQLDQPRHFGAYLHALKWNAVTATDAKLFQSPFRAGIRLMQHQLTPLTKALSLPRANLFIADDVGLGKTIEAGLVLQELLLRQRVEFVLVICPASVQLQWKEEMGQRFGLPFEIMSRHYVARVRKERGFGQNPWSTHRRFIVSHPIVRRPEYREQLLAHLRERGAEEGTSRAKKSLLILDEAHVAAPASASKWATDSEITRVVRDIAPRFENRLFLSATPHNGHSNSFSALLEILDPQRFTRGVPIRDPERLRPVMVRRLKEDLREREGIDFPKRLLVQVDLKENAGSWDVTHVTHDRSEKKIQRGKTRQCEGAATVGGVAVELELSELLRAYRSLMRPLLLADGQRSARLVFVNLQKRLLSSVPAFARTLRVHAKRLRTQGTLSAQTKIILQDEDALGLDDETLDAAEDQDVVRATEALRRGLESATESDARTRASQLLDRMLELAEARAHQPDGKTLALLDWMQQHQCAGARLHGPKKKSKAERAWTGRRVLVFTEYGDTRRYLKQMLQAAFDQTDRAEVRIAELYGGMHEDRRAEVQRDFNAPPDKAAVRVLIATDAAREGINLQGHCADLFHFDVPWNPGRLEQRNGRIDRTLQPSPEVRCHYFRYTDRAEDVVLQRLVEKVDVIRRELGSLGAVVMERIDRTLAEGIDEDTVGALDAASEPGDQSVVQAELEAQRSTQDALAAEIEEAGEILSRSAKVMEFRREHLREALDVGLELSGVPALVPVKDTKGRFELPPMPSSWSRTVDSLRVPKQRDEEWWEWRQRPPRPVVFHPPAKMNDDAVHLHLSHPFVKRILGRLLAQGYSAHDLSRVTVLRNERDHRVRAIVFGRLSLFGHGAARLHDRLLSAAGEWKGEADEIVAFQDAADRNAIAMLEDVLADSPSLDPIPEVVQRRVLDAAPVLFERLWARVREDADAEAHRAQTALTARGLQEAAALHEILATQEKDVAERMKELEQLPLSFADTKTRKREQLQLKKDIAHMDRRVGEIQKEQASEPDQLKTLYDVVLRRLEPVGLVVLWPSSRLSKDSR